MKKIDHVYWIVHPAYCLNPAYDEDQRSKKEIENFIHDKINPVIKRAQGEPNSIVIFLKTPHSSTQGLKSKFGEFRKRRIESQIETFVNRMLPTRSIVYYTNWVRFNASLTQLKTTHDLDEILKEKGFEIPKKIKMESYGSMWEVCSKEFPHAFLTHLEKQGKIKVPESGNLHSRAYRQYHQQKKP
ncbi:MAG: hypothetical protein WC915_01720 [archaeon]|jgi:hypothetical protein